MVAQPDQLDFIIADLDLFTRGEIVALTLNVDANLRESPPLGTPVDTGWARANWIPSIGSPKLPSDAGKKEPTAQDVARRAAEAQGGLNDVLGWKMDDGTIFISNGVPYINRLNNGHSPQSPPGFVQNAIAKAIRETESSGANKATRLRRSAAARTTAGKAGGTVRSEAFNRARERRNRRR